MAIDIERLSSAERLLWSYGITAPNHIDLEGIANAQNAKIVYRPLCGCEARLVTVGERAVISVNSASQQGRQRFSLAHELAHWICDRHTGSFLCAQEEIEPQNAEAKSIEARANAYASQLILPSYLVDPWAEKKTVSLDVANELAQEFNTSLTAAAIKLVKRYTAPAAIVCHNQSKLLWFQRSLSFANDYFVVRELHQDTDAFRMAFSGTDRLSKVRKEPANRWVKGSGVFQLDVQTQSIRLPDATILTSIVLLSSPTFSKKR
ncbi:ImmA/IrrE family metallo-endopeptidase [Herbaspirillum huttiense]|uniref:ImmA/IrrE family metallo-endopeptidase n=1 Tax=Herbaspirillum huttiense TaxID=863372 RepID=UPI0031D58EDE